MSRVSFLLLTFGGLLIGLAVACNHSEAQTATNGQHRLALVERACVGCHVVPQPGDLPRHLWDTVILPRMATQIATAAGVPLEELYTDGDWAAIRAHFLDAAPDELTVELLPTGPPAAFRSRFPTDFMSPPSGSFVRFGPGGGLLLADINKEELRQYDGDLNLERRLPVGRGLTDMVSADGTTYATVVGSFTPTNEGVGSLLSIDATGKRVLAEGLYRPTSLVATNLDEDPERELVVTEFGRDRGRLAVWDRGADGRFTATTIAARAGAMVVLEGGEAQTFLVLYGQGREEIVRYRRDARGTFREETLVSFPPSYGSSSLAWTDWNGDDYPDLLYTSGDNADYRPVTKPYHGVRILLGDAAGQYTETLFLPLPGAYQAVAADFDGDGQLEIAAVSFFPDFTQAEPAAAVVFDRDGEARWRMRPLPAAGAGRWLRLAAGDWNGDGRVDLAASSLAMEPVPDGGRLAEWVRQGLPFVVWENGG